MKIKTCPRAETFMNIFSCIYADEAAELNKHLRIREQPMGVGYFEIQKPQCPDDALRDKNGIPICFIIEGEKTC